MKMLEMPTVVWPALFISYSIIAFLVLVIHRSQAYANHRAPMVHSCVPSLVLPVLIAWNGLEINPARGTLQSIISMWFGQSLIWLWLTLMALGSAYYIIPSITGKLGLTSTIFGDLRLLALPHSLLGQLFIIWRRTRPEVDPGNWYCNEHCHPECCLHKLSCDSL